MRRLSLFFCLSFFLAPLFAQKLTDARLLHQPDSGVLTAAVLDTEGNLYLASTLNLKNTWGQNGILGLFPAGDPVLSKYDSDGALLWRREFPGNIARICDAALTPDGGLVITGGYVDTFRLADDWLIPGVNDYDASFFIAKLDADGDFLWADTYLSALPEDCLGWTLAVAPDAIYVAGIHEAIQTMLRRYDFDGGLQAEKILDIRSVSDLNLDEEGRLYAVGTAAPLALFANLPVPEPPMQTGYANYIARLDSSFTAHWIRAYNYITFDEHPKVAVFDGKVFLLSNDFETAHSQFGGYLLKAYTLDGDSLWSDIVLDGFFPADYQHFALQPFCDRLLLQFSTDDGMAVKSYDTDFNDSLLVSSSDGDFNGSFPVFCANEKRAIFGSNFRNAILDFGDDFSLQNVKSPGYQQFVLHFECPAPSSSSPVPSAVAALWSLSPNPATTVVYLNRLSGEVPKNARVELLDATGRLHWRGEVLAEQMPIPLETLPVGTFFLRVTERAGVVVLRGVKPVAAASE
jgi:hypothetical protein